MDSQASKQAYFEAVWAFVRSVPAGKVVTYGQIAESIAAPLPWRYREQAEPASRVVGSAMAACPADVPWHRVINAQGKVSSRADAERQLQLLQAEGLHCERGRIDLRLHQWNAQDQTEQPMQRPLF